MSDVTARGSAATGSRPELVPHWHHVRDDEPAGTGADREDGTDTPPAPPTPRASLAPVHQPAMWLVVAGVVLATVVTLLADARVGCLVLAAVLATAGVFRAVLPGPGPVGITVRSRGLDVFFFLAPAVVIAFLALTAPGVVPEG
ncbi:DUF3017 domain-containing protein [Cellulosimicrobium marinum]|uniref:DUF3017 domain-containing protein n=1 Tax=Cellulosimicrobium marinum TaxID=1638992 RepID=UPI001E5FC91E|nr:DUF3017 domain-containing protein [Cellulosimicrobium marinum]MCB7136658.1 DUF3017 domain-containing protein [Cellulosimicrobium marinum]